MRMAHRFGSIDTIILAMGTTDCRYFDTTILDLYRGTTNIYMILLSGALYGGTFIGLVALFLNLGGKMPNMY